MLRKVPLLGIISIHALLAESDSLIQPKDTPKTRISIHALLAESDACHNGQLPGIYHFYPRSPCGERRASNRQERQAQHISIHALLAESDGGSGVGS